MLIFPAIDLYEGKAVRLYKGDYRQMTVYSDRPEDIARDFAASGASWIHLVDLEGARDGTTPHLSKVLKIKETSGLCCEIGGGIRSLDTIRTYVSAGIDRVILGTAACEDPAFLQKAIDLYRDKIAVGVDVRDGLVAVRGWTKTTEKTVREFFSELEKIGVKTVICTDISKDGAMKGTNRELYAGLQKEFCVTITASGGVSTLEDVRALAELGLYGAIIGKAYYTGAIRIRDALEVAGT